MARVDAQKQREGVRAPDSRALLAIAVLAIAGAAGAVVLRLESDHGGEQPGLQAALLNWIVLSYIFSGLIAWWRRPESRFGPLMIAAGGMTLLSSISAANSDLAYSFGLAFDLVPIAVFLHAFLAFPTGRLRGSPERVLVGAAYFTAVGLQLVQLMLGGFIPHASAIAVVTAPDAAEILFKVQLIALAAMALAGIGLLAVRRRIDGPPLRRSASLLVDSFAVVLVMIAALMVTGAFFSGASAFVPIQRATLIVIGFAPIAFLVALLDARLARSAVGELLVELRAKPAPTDLREPLARALHDPSLELAYWLPQYSSWTDAEGRPVTVPRPGEGRATTEIERDGERVALLVHDPSLEQEPELLAAISATAEIALENGQLNAELRARLEELEGSRGRVIEAGQKERQRLERNLHDGAQQRLIALSLELDLLASRLQDDPETRNRIERAKGEIGVSLEELRDVARGLHPAVLSGHGLAVALESLVARSSVPVELEIDLEGRVLEPIEVAAYYVVSESLANIGKHAAAASATVSVARLDGELVVEIVDDGVGGADTEEGSGLRGLADRVEALGGRLRVWTPPGRGTRVKAEIPCAP